jgi:hypothetical protein
VQLQEAEAEQLQLFAKNLERKWLRIIFQNAANSNPEGGGGSSRLAHFVDTFQLPRQLGRGRSQCERRCDYVPVEAPARGYIHIWITCACMNACSVWLDCACACSKIARTQVHSRRVRTYPGHNDCATCSQPRIAHSLSSPAAASPAPSSLHSYIHAQARSM